MKSGIIVYKKVVPGITLDETIEKCLTVYEDKLLAYLSSQDKNIRDLDKSLELERTMQKHSETFLPDRFKDKGYSRLRAVYAFPFEFPESWCYPNRVPPQNCFADRETVIRMVVDEYDALVLPMSIMNSLYNRRNYSWNRQIDTRKIKEYWASAVTLEEFEREFKNPQELEYIWISKDGMKRLDTPEVLIPEWSLRKVSFLNAPKNSISMVLS